MNGDRASLDVFDVLNIPQLPTTDSEPDQGGGGKAGVSIQVPATSPREPGEEPGGLVEYPVDGNPSPAANQGDY